MTITLTRPTGPWRVLHAAEKLLVRGALPGAYGFDLAAHGARVARARGVGVRELLPLAMPTSWMVNNRAPSPTFRAWLTQRTDAWVALCELLDGGAAAWPEVSPAERETVTSLVRTLSIQGQGLCAISKVLAVLCPQTVPLLDDAAIAFALGLVPMPATADAPTATADALVVMLDWFSAAVRANEDALIALARDYALAPLDAAQVLDRLLWMESWGWSHSGPLDAPTPRFWWLADGAREGIARLEGPHPPFATGRRVDLATVSDDTWRERARAELHHG
jgi:hypothetical protein